MTHPSASWPLASVVATIDAVGVAEPTAIETELFSAEAQFGRGLIHPFRRDKKGDWANETGPKLVVSSVTQILGTRAESDVSEGEILWRPDLGSKLYLLKHEPNSQITRELARVYVIGSLSRWEQRARVTDVTTTSEDTSLIVAVRFNFVDLQSGAVIFQGLESSITV